MTRKTSPLDQFLNEVLDSVGFTMAGPGLYTAGREGNVALLSISRATYSGDGWVDLSPYLAVDSARLATASHRSTKVAFPEISTQPWYRWAFAIHEDEEIEGWGSVSEANPLTWAAVQSDLVDRIVPTLLEHTSDAGLRDCWTRHRDPFISEAMQLAYLSILTKDIGPVATFQESRGALELLLQVEGESLPGYAIVQPLLAVLDLPEHADRQVPGVDSG